MSTKSFNYIITIHNKEDILGKTLEAVDLCSGINSVIYPVLDGCTDKSETITNEFAKNSRRRVVIIKTPDVHELLTINAALLKISSGHTIVIQDDVWLKDMHQEDKLSELYERSNNQIGVVSFRLAANLAKTNILRQIRRSGLVPLARETDIIQKNGDFGNEAEVTMSGFYPRMVAIKGPNCIPEHVRNSVGILDPLLAPYCMDDHDYCIRAMTHGFTNGLFPLDFISEKEWGGTRTDKSFTTKLGAIQKRNRRRIWRSHGAYIYSLYNDKHPATKALLSPLNPEHFA